MSVTSALTRGEKGRLKDCETVIERGVTVFVEVGKALTEIRDAKLYRDTHGTFEAYCRERWDFGKSRAYQLIEHAKVARIIGEAAQIRPTALDISHRDGEALAADLSAAVADIKERVEAGQDPAEATAEVTAAKRAEWETAKQERQARQAEHDRQRDEARSALPEGVQRIEAAKEANRQKGRETRADMCGSDDNPHMDRIAELEENVRFLEARVAELESENKLYGEMKASWGQGGYEKVIAGRDEEIRVLREQFHAENAEKVREQKRAKKWEKILREQYRHFEPTVIDAKTRSVVRG